MSDHPSLFDLPHAPPHVRGSATSLAAAISVADTAGTLRSQVFAFVARRDQNGATCWEAERDMGLRHQTASARIRELAQSGALVDSGRKRRTETGRLAVVWIAKAVAEKEMAA